MGVTVRAVSGRRDLARFIKLPWRLYRDEPNWVPPLILERKRFLDRARNPFFKHAEAEYFLAQREGEVVGRVSAHIDDNYIAEHDQRDGMFGFLECENDPEAARALLDTASNWLKERNCERALGPMDFTTNDEVGLLVDGYERQPIILCNWHHPYYGGLIEGAGYTKAMDLLMYELSIEGKEKILPIVWELAEKLEPEHGISIRAANMRDWDNELRRFLDVYNSAWEKNWGFVPLTDEEIEHRAKEMKPIIDENWVMIAEQGEEVVGAALTLLDYNQVLKKMNGRLLPFGWAKFLHRRRKIDRVRVFALGVKPEYQHTGVAAGLYIRHWEYGPSIGINKGEMGWILESNVNMNRGMEAMGGRVVSRYRIFEKAL